MSASRCLSSSLIKVLFTCSRLLISSSFTHSSLMNRATGLAPSLDRRRVFCTRDHALPWENPLFIWLGTVLPYSCRGFAPRLSAAPVVHTASGRIQVKSNMLAAFLHTPGPDPVISYRPSPQASANSSSRELAKRIRSDQRISWASSASLSFFSSAGDSLPNFSSICWDNTSQRPNRLPFSSPSCRPFSNPSCSPFLNPPAGAIL